MKAPRGALHGRYQVLRYEAVTSWVATGDFKPSAISARSHAFVTRYQVPAVSGAPPRSPVPAPADLARHAATSPPRKRARFRNGRSSLNGRPPGSHQSPLTDNVFVFRSNTGSIRPTSLSPRRIGRT